jgi:squalene-hopene/tetraprenyl-beta-curcumene cyclase
VEDTVAWQRSNNCYGCHVQAVTLDAMIVGRRNHYDVPDDGFAEVLRGMTDVPGGVRGPNGFSVGGSPGHLIETSKAFGGAALAEYDEHIATDLSAELARTAEDLLEYQDADGSVRSTDHRPPVVAGLMQSTTQAARTWRQAYARSADERWLPPIARAEGYIRERAAALTDEHATYLQDLSYAIIGLLAAGASQSEPVVEMLGAELRERQGADGGWGFAPGEASDAFATGQSLYVLKRLGTSDSDPAVRRGIDWLVEHQMENGGWSGNGDRRGEAMWAVLGLVSIDVLSIDVAGLSDGAHARGSLALRVTAVDRAGSGAREVEIRVDDVPVARACGGELSHAVDVSRLEAGAHRIDIVATDAAGKSTRRRVGFYAGDHFLTRVGTRFESESTVISLRNVAPREERGRVRLRIFRAADDGSGRGERVFEQTEAASPGAMQFTWNGHTNADAVAGRGRYVAEVAYVDARGRERHAAEVPFVHDTEEAQANAFGQVAGSVALDEGEVEGASVELVDEGGRVLQRATTTSSGQYRFRNVETGRYRVRVQRRGFRAEEAPVSAAPASSAEADFALQAE